MVADSSLSAIATRRVPGSMASTRPGIAVGLRLWRDGRRLGRLHLVDDLDPGAEDRHQRQRDGLLADLRRLDRQRAQVDARRRRALAGEPGLDFAEVEAWRDEALRRAEKRHVPIGRGGGHPVIDGRRVVGQRRAAGHVLLQVAEDRLHARWAQDRKSTRLNSSHEWISYAVFCLKKKKIDI